MPPIPPAQDGFLSLDQAKLAASFAADVEPATAQFMADSQVPWGVGTFDSKVARASWKIKPGYYLVAENDRMIPPPAVSVPPAGAIRPAAHSGQCLA